MQAGRDPERVQREALLQAGQELVQGEGAAQGGVTSLRLERTPAEQTVQGQRGFLWAEGALQEQVQTADSLQRNLQTPARSILAEPRLCWTSCGPAGGPSQHTESLLTSCLYVSLLSEGVLTPKKQNQEQVMS